MMTDVVFFFAQRLLTHLQAHQTRSIRAISTSVSQNTAPRLEVEEGSQHQAVHVSVQP